MKITLKQISLLNFKGVRNYKTSFGHKTSIYGDNATFKTSLFDAFTFLLFGKNSLDQQQFEIKTLNKFNKPIPKLNHEVKAIIEIDNVEKEFKRVLREKWVKKRGEQETEFAGNTEDFFIDRVPLSKTDYQKAISEIISEDQFKLLTNPLYFNSVMDWKTRRNMLFKMAGDVSYVEIAERHEQLQGILPEIEKKSIEGLKKQIDIDKKTIKKEIDQNIPRIDEQTRTMPEMPNVDRINNEIVQYQERLESIDGNLDAINKTNKAKREALQEKYNKINELTEQKLKLQQEARDKAREGNSTTQKEINKHKSEITDRNVKIDSLSKKVDNSQREIEYLQEQNNILREQIKTLNDNNPDFSKVQEVCPTCKRPFNPDEIEAKKDEIEKAFNEEKVKKYNTLRSKGIANKEELEFLSREIINWQDKISIWDNEIKQIEGKIPEFFHDYKPENFLDEKKLLKIDNGIKSLQEELTQPQPRKDDMNLHEERQKIQNKIDKLRAQLSVLKTIDDKKIRIKQLEAESKDLAQQLANIEKREYLAEMFESAYVSSVEEKINSIFKNVQFRMFKEQINGGRVEDCTLIVNGVPWNDLNSGGKIQAGIECINTIGQYFDCYAPIFCDNSESVTILPETKSQLIRLVKDEKYQELMIEKE
jgi:DNA repair protein SbcC/Rad50